MSKTPVYPTAVEFLFIPFSGLADDDDSWPILDWVNPNREDHVRFLLRQLVVPLFEQLSESAQGIIRQNLYYVLHLAPEIQTHCFESHLPLFNLQRIHAIFMSGYGANYLTRNRPNH